MSTKPRRSARLGRYGSYEGLDSTFIVMNGDILTTLDYGELFRYHRASGNVLTIATHDRTIKIDYGMLHLDAG